MKAGVQLVSAQEGDWLLGGRHQIKVAGAASGGRFCFWTTPTVCGDGPPLHTHDRAEEVFFVLAGAYDIQVGAHWRRAVPGEAMLLPSRIPHRYRGALPGGTSWALQIVAPAGLEEYFRLIGDASPSTVEGMKLRRRVGDRYGLAFPTDGARREPVRPCVPVPWTGTDPQPLGIEAGAIAWRTALPATPEGGAAIDVLELGATASTSGRAAAAGSVLFGCSGCIAIRAGGRSLSLTPGATVYLPPATSFAAAAAAPSRLVVFAVPAVSPVR